MTVAPNSPKARSQASSMPGQNAAATQAAGDAQENAGRPVPQRAGHILQHRIDSAEGRARGDDEEGRGDEGFGEHDAGEGIRQRPTGQGADRARIAQQEEQQDAAGQRRQGQGHLHHEAEQAPSPGSAAGRAGSRAECRPSAMSSVAVVALRTRDERLPAPSPCQSAPCQSAKPRWARPARKGARR